jgi:hypothetical protein
LDGLESEVILTEERTLRKFPWLKGGLGNMKTVTLSETNGLLTTITALDEMKETHQVVKVETRDGGVHGYFVKPISESLVYTDEECWTRQVWGTLENCKEWANILNDTLNSANAD